jgi:hypothetical protein
MLSSTSQTPTSPRHPGARELLLSTVRTFLVTLGHKDNVINSLFGEDRKF